MNGIKSMISLGSSRFGVFVTALACTAMASSAAWGQATFNLHGVVRDFHRTDPNINALVSGGNGHYAGNIGLSLAATDTPMFVGGGKKVLSQFRDQDNHAIAPHMYIDASAAGGGTVPVVHAPTINNQPTIDTFDPSLGPYSKFNCGPAPTFVAGSTMPTVTVPAMPPKVEEVKYDGNGVSTLSQNIHCHKFLLRNNRTLRISGAVVIVADEEFVVENHTKIELLAGATLTVYAKKDIKFQNNTDVNMNTSDSSRMTVYNLGPNNLIVENSARLYARVVSPNAAMHVKNNCDFYGRFTGRSAIIDNSAGFHIEAGMTICGVEPNDVAGTHGVLSAGGIPSAAAFNTWFTDVLGSNLSQPHTVLLRRDVTGAIWQFASTSFYPVDKKLFGNEGQLHNNYFTYSVKVRFTHHACEGRFFEFNGNDDAWAFIDGELVLDRGGVNPGVIPQWVEADRLGLVDGHVYDLHFFYVQRNPLQSVFRLRTSLDLIEEPMIVQTTAPAD